MKLNKIDYLEFATTDLPATKQFFSDVFGWVFVDYGLDYSSFMGQGVDGGFYSADRVATTDIGAPLSVFYTDGIDVLLSKVIAAGGEVTKPIFDFPGGRRFQFIEPGSNELGVWTDK
jgi:predicted enzyme related to lactoylglutathione lyase